MRHLIPIYEVSITTSSSIWYFNFYKKDSPNGMNPIKLLKMLFTWIVTAERYIGGFKCVDALLSSSIRLRSSSSSVPMKEVFSVGTMRQSTLFRQRVHICPCLTSSRKESSSCTDFISSIVLAWTSRDCKLWFSCDKTDSWCSSSETIRCSLTYCCLASSSSLTIFKISSWSALLLLHPVLNPLSWDIESWE